MLRDADAIDEAMVHDLSFAPVSVRQATPAIEAIVAPVQRYGDAKRFNMTALIVTILVHVLLVAVVLMVKQHIVHKRVARLTVMNLTPSAPPPSETPPPPQVKPVVMAPRPIVDVPTQPVLLMPTTPDPVPLTAAVSTPAPSTAPPAPPAPPSIIQGGDIGAQMVSGKPPSYPIESRRKNEVGTVVLLVIVGLDGGVARISINRSSGYSRLDNAALDAVRKWRWNPIKENGRPVMVEGYIEMPFTLKAAGSR